MRLKPSLQLASVIKSLKDAVLPALDPTNRMALEQLHIALAHLALLQERLPLSYRFECDELRRSKELAETLRDLCDATTHRAHYEALAEIAASAGDILARAGAEPDEIQRANTKLRAANAQAVSALSVDPVLAGAARRAVLDSAREQLLRDRAWVLPQGWESQPQSLPRIENLLVPVGNPRA